MLEKILESISDGVFTVDLNWKIMYFNRAAEEITGIKRKDALGKNCCEVFKSNMCENQCPLRKTLKSGKPLIDRTGYIIDLKGEKIPISVSTAILQNEKGEVIGGAETFRNLSELYELKKEIEGRKSFGDMFSESFQMQKIFSILPAVSECSSTVLIQGETGTGKEVLAKTIHKMSGRAQKPFIAINCSALPDTLLESELFGYKKGAFTGADRDKAGKFTTADGGTLFLDEIGELSGAFQVKLLRVLQEREYEPLGSNEKMKTDARIIAATNKDLSEMVKKNEIRQDLFYRLNVITIELPPLRKRKQDIPYLAEQILQRLNILQKKNIAGFSHDVISAFFAWAWPGNIRELENVIERAFVLCSRKTISLEDLPPELIATDFVPSKTSDIRKARILVEERTILDALERNNNNRSAAAKELGIDKTTFYRKVKNYGIKLPQKRRKSSPGNSGE